MHAHPACGTLALATCIFANKLLFLFEGGLYVMSACGMLSVLGAVHGVPAEAVEHVHIRTGQNLKHMAAPTLCWSNQHSMTPSWRRITVPGWAD